MDTQICSKCGMLLPLTRQYFYTAYNKYYKKCKTCHNKITKMWQVKNKNYINERFRIKYKTDENFRIKDNEKSKHFREDNPEIMRKLRSQWYFANKLERNQYLKEYRLKNSEKLKSLRKKWNQTFPEKGRYYNRMRRALKNHVNENFSIEDKKYIMNLFDEKCCNCGADNNLCIDHFKPLSKGFALSRTNAIILCGSCNLSKNTKDPQIFFNIDKYQEIISKLWYCSIKTEL